MSQSTIPCPNCGAKITFDTVALIRGASFKCAVCDLTVSLGGNRHPDVTAALKAFDALRPHLEGKT